MKRAICLLLLVMIPGVAVLPSFAQYRKPVREMSDEELEALSRELRDKAERYTRRTRAALSSVIGQDIGLELDGLVLLKKNYPHLVAAIVERATRAASDPMFMAKSTKAGPSLGDRLFNTGMTMCMGMVAFVDQEMENDIAQDVRRQFEIIGADITEAEIDNITERISDDMMDDLAEAASLEGNYALALFLNLYTLDEITREKRWRQEMRRRNPQPGPANGAPTGQPGPQGWIRGRQGTSFVTGRPEVTVTLGGCAHITYDSNNNPIVTFVPCD